MPQFLVRVELTGPCVEAGTYSLMDECLAAIGIMKTITGNKSRQLPTGTYLATSYLPTNEVAALIIAALKRAGLAGRVLVVLMLDWAAKGLVAVEGEPVSVT